MLFDLVFIVLWKVFVLLGLVFILLGLLVILLWLVFTLLFGWVFNICSTKFCNGNAKCYALRHN